MADNGAYQLCGTTRLQQRHSWMTTECHSLQRFLEAQRDAYAIALAELRRGRKTSHWMWFIFPQLAGLGRSHTAQHYALASLDEAVAYLKHTTLGARLRECVQALQALPLGNSAAGVFGEVDAVKLRSSLTLFESAGGGDLFSAALVRWFSGVRDDATRKLLAGR
jgi:uncharacterized protein (DUF1810 family)